MPVIIGGVALIISAGAGWFVRDIYEKHQKYEDAHSLDLKDIRHITADAIQDLDAIAYSDEKLAPREVERAVDLAAGRRNLPVPYLTPAAVTETGVDTAGNILYTFRFTVADKDGGNAVCLTMQQMTPPTQSAFRDERSRVFAEAQSVGTCD
ncbi:hypothetical protein [Yinghuangia sp. YIM S09857]|uniref:hypothetical protein n=1 Tax=Yinghuangia sp. YIM S09857 TaxID=3436929 RepID=UPI003F52C0A7